MALFSCASSVFVEVSVTISPEDTLDGVSEATLDARRGFFRGPRRENLRNIQVVFAKRSRYPFVLAMTHEVQNDFKSPGSERVKLNVNFSH